ncbi:MAG: hypothetical protein PHY54_20060 [Methylococcales bacterium]|nr:hypothetical protein [Methylococcales bacterium]
MNILQIARIEVLESGQLAVTPAEPDDSYQYIYRAAGGMEWVNLEGRFLIPSQSNLGAPFSLTTEQRFEQLADALIGEFGLRPSVSAKSVWVSVPEEVRSNIETRYAT